MFVKCAYVFDLIDKLDISMEKKIKIENEINHLINLLMFGDERRPVTLTDNKENKQCLHSKKK